jgi:glycosyltransferase involved in cell wall biosynthesis
MNSIKNNILVLNDFPICPVNHGGKVRIYNVYKNIAQIYRVKYLCFGNSTSIEETQISEKFYEIRIPKQRMHRKLIKLAYMVFGCSADDLVALFIARYNGTLNEIIKQYITDSSVVILSHPYMYPAVKPFLKNQFVIYEAHNVEYLLKNSSLNRNLLSKAVLKQLWSVEKALVHRCDLCFTTSDLDKKTFCNLYDIKPSKIIVAPNGVNPEIYLPKLGASPYREEKIISPPLVVFLGSGHYPNVEATRLIIQEIAPKMPDVYFLICGSVCWSVQNELHSDNIGLAYMIDEDEKIELFRVADIAINPMKSGSGTNVKMLDFMAAGLPVVTTPTGARGLNIKNGIHGIICSIEEFPGQIRRLLNDIELYRNISENERKIVEESYDWKKISTLMINAIPKN